ncbi:MAG: hypothetical protein Q9221_006736 [Calogaya cf. arnoldii]
MSFFIFNRRHNSMAKALLFLFYYIWVVTGSQTGLSVHQSENYHAESSSPALTEPAPYTNPNLTPHPTTDLIPRANESPTKNTTHLAFRQFIRFTASASQLAASSSPGKATLQFLSQTALSLRSNSKNLTGLDDKILDLYYGGLRIYAFMQNVEGIVISGLQKTQEGLEGLIRIVEDLADYARKGWNGLCEVNLRDLRFSTAAVVGSGVVTFSIFFFLTAWALGDQGGIRPMLPPPGSITMMGLAAPAA